MNYVEGVRPGEYDDADMVNLVAAAVNNQPRKATKIVESDAVDWEMIAANAIACLSWMVRVLPKLGDMMTEGTQKHVDMERVTA